jgi:hypothetical protein
MSKYFLAGAALVVAGVPAAIGLTSNDLVTVGRGGAARGSRARGTKVSRLPVGDIIGAGAPSGAGFSRPTGGPGMISA